MRIGLLSDTHGYLDDRILHHLQGVDLILHAGDVGDYAVIEQLEQVAPTKAVYGNIDGTTIRSHCPEVWTEALEGVVLMMIHIAGPIGKYNPYVRKRLLQTRPNVLICGHSHILKIKQDPAFHLLHVNPGAAGRHGFHKVRTLILFEVEGGKVKDMKVVELGPRSAKSID